MLAIKFKTNKYYPTIDVSDFLLPHPLSCLSRQMLCRIAHGGVFYLKEYHAI